MEYAIKVSHGHLTKIKQNGLLTDLTTVIQSLKRKLKNATREAIKDLQIKFKTNYKYAIFAKQKIYNTEFKKIVKELKFKLLEI